MNINNKYIQPSLDSMQKYRKNSFSLIYLLTIFLFLIALTDASYAAPKISSVSPRVIQLTTGTPVTIMLRGTGLNAIRGVALNRDKGGRQTVRGLTGKFSGHERAGKLTVIFRGRAPSGNYYIHVTNGRNPIAILPASVKVSAGSMVRGSIQTRGSAADSRRKVLAQRQAADVRRSSITRQSVVTGLAASNRPIVRALPSGRVNPVNSTHAARTDNFTSLVPPAPAKPSVTIIANHFRVTWRKIKAGSAYRVFRCTGKTTGSCVKISTQPSSQYDDYGFRPGVGYYYRVKACSQHGCSNYSPYSTGFFPPTPAKPSASDHAFSDKVRISWPRVSWANRYKVYRCTGPAGQGQCTTSFDTITIPYDDTAATPGTTYYYRIAACQGNMCGHPSAPDAGTRKRISPQVPTAPSASDNTFSDRVDVTWRKKSSDFVYLVYRCKTRSTSNCTLIDESTSNQYHDTGAASGTRYYYRLQACNSGSCSDYSPYSIGRRKLVPPAAPAGGSASRTVTDKISIFWNLVSNATSYKIYRCSNSSVSSCGSAINVTSPKYDDTDVPVETSFYYRAKACNAAGCSDLSNPSLRGMRARPGRPRELSASMDTYPDKIVISWKLGRSGWGGGQSMEYYLVYRCKGNVWASSIQGSAVDADCGDSIARVTTTSYTDANMERGRYHYYRVKGCQSGACSKYSDAVMGRAQ